MIDNCPSIDSIYFWPLKVKVQYQEHENRENAEIVFGLYSTTNEAT